MSLDLPLIWALLIAVAVFAYVVLDGFDLGVGILFPFVHGKDERDVMVNSVAPVWDGNETWLVLGGGGLFAVFPLAYAILLPALYMPITLMLLGLVFRGVAFEMRFRARSDREQRWWDRAFQWGSLFAAFNQGIALGGFVQGVKVSGRAYAGGWWDWLTPFSLLTGAALVVGYVVMRLALVPLWLRAARDDREHAAVARTYAVGIVAVQALWVARLALPDRAEAVTVRALRRAPDHQAYSAASGSWPASAAGSTFEFSSSTDRPSERISLTRTLKLSGMPASNVSSPRTIASYTLVRPATSSDFTVSISCSV